MAFLYPGPFVGLDQSWEEAKEKVLIGDSLEPDLPHAVDV